MDNDILYEYRYPRSGPLRCLAVLVGDTPIPGKIRSFVYEAYAYFVITPCGVAFRVGAAYVCSFTSFVPALPRRNEKYVSLFMVQAKAALCFLLFSQPAIIIKPIIHGRKICLHMKISIR